MGQTLGDEVAAKLPASIRGTVVLGTSSPGVRVLDRRASGIRDEIRKKRTGVSVIGPFDTKQETAANFDAWQTLVKANPKALAFVGTGDADGWNLAAIRAANKATWAAGAFDLDSRSLDAVRKSDLVLVSPEHYLKLKGAVAGRLQADHAKNGTALPKGWIYIPGAVVDQANIDMMISRQSTQANRRAYFEPLITKIFANESSYPRPIDNAG